MYVVVVYENSHYMDEEESYEHGRFGTCQEAVAACRKIVDDYLQEAYKGGMSSNDLYDNYKRWGDDPHIVAIDGAAACEFSAWEYAEKRCGELASSR